MKSIIMYNYTELIKTKRTKKVLSEKILKNVVYEILHLVCN